MKPGQRENLSRKAGPDTEKRSFACDCMTNGTFRSQGSSHELSSNWLTGAGTISSFGCEFKATAAPETLEREGEALEDSGLKRDSLEQLGEEADKEGEDFLERALVFAALALALVLGVDLELKACFGAAASMRAA